jgi:hypothetical protein
MTTDTLKEQFAKQHEKWLIGTDDDAEMAQEWVMENLPSLLTLLPSQTTCLEEVGAAKAHYQEYMSGVEDLEPSWDELPEDHRERMIRAMRTALADTGWRDISTAPKDGTKFLALGETGYSVAFYRYEEWRKKRYFTVAHGEFYQSGAKFKPIYWMPLPPLTREEG